ncbi:AAA family ATPase [Schlesneria sp. T3-172]|uniref:AAA family ATPase n=1 Tax=Schlesneria sphaerica TaxID=3373610 RepID=UPI0037C8A14D
MVAQALLQRLSDVMPKSIDWACEGLIPFGKLSLLTGEPGIGKSFLALHLAAMVTRGTSAVSGTPGSEGWQGEADNEFGSKRCLENRPRSVVVLSAEDAADDTVLPRLAAAGGDTRCVYVLRGSEPGESRCVSSTDESSLAAEDCPPVTDCREPRLFRLKQDLSRLEESLEELADAGEEIGLIVIDPIDRFFGPTDNRRDRVEVVSRLVELAHRTGAAILVVTNVTAKTGSRIRCAAYHELMNAARSVLLAAEDLEHPGQRLLLPVKTNLTATPAGRAFVIDEGRLVWNSEAVALSSADYQHQMAVKLKNPLVREEVYEIQRVTRWLKDQLTPGRASSIWIRSNASYYDISYSTLRRAFKSLGCRAMKVKNQWFWSLPGQDGPACEELLEEPLVSPEGDLLGIYRESMPYWLREELAAEETKSGTQATQWSDPAPQQTTSPEFGGDEEDAHEDAHEGAQCLWPFSEHHLEAAHHAVHGEESAVSPSRDAGLEDVLVGSSADSGSSQRNQFLY